MAQVRRRQYIVDRSFQLKYTLLISLVGGAISVIFGAWMWDAHRTNTDLLVLNEALAMDSALKDEVLAADQSLLWVFLFVTLLMIAALGLLGVLVTHRVAGPAFVMSRYLSVVADGAYPTMRPLRSKDELKDFFTALEEAIERLRSRDRGDAEALDRVLDSLGRGEIDEESLTALRAIRDRKRQAVAGATDPDGETGAPPPASEDAEAPETPAPDQSDAPLSKEPAAD